MSDRLPRLAAIILLTWTSSLLVASAWAHGVTLKVQHPLIGTPAGIGGRLLAALGALPVELPDERLSEALSGGTIDGALLPWDRVAAPDIARSVRYHSETDPKSPWLYSTVFMFAMSAASYRSLSDDLRKVIDANSGIETAAWIGRVFGERAAAARKLAVERGDTINVLSSQELDRWRKPAQAVVDSWLEALGKAGVNGKPMLQGAREAQAAYDTMK